MNSSSNSGDNSPPPVEKMEIQTQCKFHPIKSLRKAKIRKNAFCQAARLLLMRKIKGLT